MPFANGSNSGIFPLARSTLDKTGVGLANAAVLKSVSAASWETPILEIVELESVCLATVADVPVCVGFGTGIGMLAFPVGFALGIGIPLASVAAGEELVPAALAPPPPTAPAPVEHFHRLHQHHLHVPDMVHG